MDNTDSFGNLPKFHAGDRVMCLPMKMEANVISQQRCYDYPEWFWGNVELLYDDGVRGVSSSWQLELVHRAS